MLCMYKVQSLAGTFWLGVISEHNDTSLISVRIKIAHLLLLMWKLLSEQKEIEFGGLFHLLVDILSKHCILSSLLHCFTLQIAFRNVRMLYFYFLPNVITSFHLFSSAVPGIKNNIYLFHFLTIKPTNFTPLLY